MGILFSRGATSTRQSSPHQELLTSAAEIVARQREEEEQRKRSEGEQQGSAAAETPPTSPVRSVVENSPASENHSDTNPASSERPSRVSNRHFESLSDLLRSLLNDGRIRVRISTDGEHLNMWFEEQDERELSTDGSSDDERNRRSLNSNDARTPESVVEDSPPAIILPKPELSESLLCLREEIRVRSGVSGPESLLNAVRRREMGVSKACIFSQPRPVYQESFRTSRSLTAFRSSQKSAFTNMFPPNRRKIVDKQRTKVFCCHYLPRGDALLTGSQDEVIRLYRREGVRRKYGLVHSFRAPYVGWSILDLIVSPDGRHCVYSTWSDKLYQRSLDGGVDAEQWSTLNQDAFMSEGRFAFFSLRFNYDGAEIVSGGSDGRLYVYDRERDTTVVRIEAHDDDLNAVCFSDTSRYLLFSAGDDGLCKAWDRRALGEDNRPVGVFAGHRDGITFIDSKGDDRYLLTNSKDQTIKIWDIRHFSSVEAQEETRKAVGRQAWDYRYEAAPHGIYRVRPLKEDGSILTLRRHSVLHTLIRAHFSPLSTGQRYIYTGCALGQCVVYDLLTGGVDRVLSGHRSVVRDCAWHPFDNEIVTTSWDGETAVWRYDERARRIMDPVDPDKPADDADEEDSTDEYYQPIPPRRYVVKRKTAAGSSPKSETKVVRI